MKLQVDITVKLDETQLKLIMEKLPEELALRLKGKPANE